MPAKAAEPKSETPADLSHIRVGPAFVPKRKGRCVNGGHPLAEGAEAHVVENTRAETKKLICAECLKKNTVLQARLQTDDLGSFLSE